MLTRRFFARLASLVFGATGSASARPSTLIRPRSSIAPPINAVAALARDGLARLDLARRTRLPRAALLSAHLTRPLLTLARLALIALLF